MNAGIVGSLILWLIVAVIVVAVVVYLLNWLYHQSTKELAFVRTGLGGERVVINGGSLVLPIVHEVTLVNLNVVRIVVSRTENAALITSDRMRVDIEAEFFVRVMQQPEAVAAAASTLGRRTLDPDQLADLLSGKFIGALRLAAARMTLDDMHERRLDFVSMVKELAADALALNGLELESVAITDLDQTDLQYFNPANRFDAEGLTQLIATIEERRKLRNDIEQSSSLAIRQRNLEAEIASLQLEQQSESSRLDQERALEALRAEQRAEISRTKAKADTEAEKSKIESEQQAREFDIDRSQKVEESEIRSRQSIEQARIAHEQAIEKARIAQELSVEQARIEREKQVRREQIAQRHDLENAEIVANEDIERARIVSGQQLLEVRISTEQAAESLEIARGQSIETAKLSAKQIVEEARIQQQRELQQLEIDRERTLELAQIERQIALLNKRSEQSVAQIGSEDARAQAVVAEEKVTTARETEVAERIALIDVLVARKDAETANLAAEAERITEAVAAEARRLRHEAENVLSEEARAGALREQMINRLEGIVRESVRPLENIEGIKILHVDGLSGGGSNSPRSPTDEVIESALRYRAQAPLIDEMLKEIGVANPSVSRMGDIFRSAKDAKSLAQTERPDESKE